MSALSELMEAEPGSVPVAVARAVLADHRPHGRVTCGSRTDGPVAHRHNGRRQVDELVMTCSRPEGHEGDHQDAVCCWSFHSFPEEAAVDGPGRDLRHCSQCGRPWPCPDARGAQGVLP